MGKFSSCLLSTFLVFLPLLDCTFISNKPLAVNHCLIFRSLQLVTVNAALYLLVFIAVCTELYTIVEEAAAASNNVTAHDVVKIKVRNLFEGE